MAGEGVSEPAGGPHAEVIALDAAGEGARGGTLYVTMEPCAHHGRTPPCVDAIVAAGVAASSRGAPTRAPKQGRRRSAARGGRRGGALDLGRPAAERGMADLGARRRPHVTLKLAITWTGGSPSRAGDG